MYLPIGALALTIPVCFHLMLALAGIADLLITASAAYNLNIAHTI